MSRGTDLLRRYKIPQDPGDWTEAHLDRAINLALTAFDRYERYTGDLRGRKGTELYRDYQRRTELVDLILPHFPWRRIQLP